MKCAVRSSSSFASTPRLHWHRSSTSLTRSPTFARRPSRSSARRRMPPALLHHHPNLHSLLLTCLVTAVSRLLYNRRPRAPPARRQRRRRRALIASEPQRPSPHVQQQQLHRRHCSSTCSRSCRHWYRKRPNPNDTNCLQSLMISRFARPCFEARLLSLACMAN